MVVWTGWGILVVVIFLAIGAPIQLLVESSYGKPYYEAHSWPGILACLLAAPLIWFTGRALNREKVPEASDSETAEGIRVRYTGRHAFFFVPMEYWSLVVLVAGIVLFFSKPSF